MAEDEAMRGPSEVEESESGSASESEDSEPVETLVEGRSKRATAGNRLSNLLDKEADKNGNEELELLFAEQEDDIDFQGADGEDVSDVQLDSSSDDEDQGPNAAGDDELEGEKEIERLAKAERQAKKRKAQDPMSKLPAMRKKVKIDPTAASKPVTTPAPRPKKKSERVSWLPTPEEGPTRASSRRQTMHNKEATHARLVESEKKRIQILATMETAAKNKEKDKPKEMTQADRLVEAAKTERVNSKSLNRWEETEKKRAEEQKAKLAALHNRRLEGPVVSWWSGLAKWINGKLAQVGMKERPEDVDSERNRKKKGRESLTGEPRKYKTKKMKELEALEAPNHDREGVSPAELVPAEQEGPANAPQITFAPPQGPSSFLDGIQYYASMPGEASHASNPQPDAPQIYVDQLMTTAPPLEPAVEHSTRNLVVLENFDPKTVQERGEYGIFFNSRRAPKLQKPTQELCVITSQPARYRDPATGLPYANSHAFREVQKAQENNYTWSCLLGCYVGAAGAAARGVPEGFVVTSNALGAAPPWMQ